ncbi:MAG: hypothetical protein AAB215_09655 [Planctomycetota bacterium]
MSRPLPPSVEPLVRVAEALGPLLPEVAFLGGAVLPLLLTDPAASPARPTLDVDAVVQPRSRAAYHEFEAKLRGLGFRNDTSEGAPLCRWIIRGVIADIIPADPSILGFSNPWHEEAMKSAHSMEIKPGLTIRVVTPPVFLAAKHAAFRDPARGRGDYLASRDIEDIIALADGRPELDAEIRGAGPEIRAHLRDMFSALLNEPRFLDALPGHLPPDPGSQARLPRLERLLRAWAAM